jgi:pyruvate dehydrogenase E2 component (dihydrolipoamide acetyltransferase)
MADVVMPRLSDSMEEGTIVRWLVDDGASVSRGDEIVEIETDKATMTYEADSDGVLSIVASEGDTLPIGQLIARIDGAGPAKAEAQAPEQARQEEPREEEAREEQPREAEAREEPREEEPPEEEPPETPSPPRPQEDGGERVKASPVARRMARERGLELRGLAGSGPGGRIVKADVEAAAEGPAQREAAQAPAARPEPARAETAKGEVSVEELTRTQQTIARRMAESRATVPDFTLAVDVDMQQAVEGRAALKAAAGGDEVVPSLNDLVVKACAVALREHPRANAAYRDGRFELYSRVNIGVAVAAEGSLVVPTVFDADRKGLRQIARETRELADKVRAGSITPPEVSGATFTVSNLGMYGIREFVAVINPPQAALLSVGAVEERPAVRDGEVSARPLMSVTLACDHRILYGAPAAQFLARVKSLLEAPLSLAL